MATRIPESGKYLSLFISVTIFALLPFIYSLKLQDVEQSPRLLVLAVIVIFASLFALIYSIKKSVLIKRDKFYLLPLAFLLINSIAFFRSINFGDGLFEFLKYLLLFSLFFQFVLLFSNDEKNKLIFFKAIAVSALIFIGFGISQLIPAISDTINNGIPMRINYSISSTLGNKNFFSETLLMMLPVTLIAILYHSALWRFVFIVTSITIFLFLVLLQTLSTWVALIVASAFILLLIFRFQKKLFFNAKSYRSFYLGVAGILLLIFAFAFIFFSVTGTAQLKNRIVTIQKILHPAGNNQDLIYENSTYERIQLWKNSLTMTSDYPISGAGLANWKLLSPGYGIGSAVYMSSGVIRFVHPHNDFLLIAAETGIPGLLIFILLFVFLIKYSLSISAKAKTTNEIYFGLAMLFGLIAYIIISFFSLPSSRIYPPVLFLFLAALIITEYLKTTPSVKVIERKWISLVLIISLVTGITAILVGNKRLRADFAVSSALLHEHKNNHAMMKRYLETIDRKFYPVDATATPVAWYLGFANFYLGVKESAFTLFKEAEKTNPGHLMVLNDLGTSYNLSGDAVTAQTYYKKALSIQPDFGEALINLSIIYFNSGDLEAAYTTLVKHRGKINTKSVPVFNTILSAQAATITNDQYLLEIFNTKLKNPQTIAILLKEIRSQKDGLKTVLKKK